MIQFIAFQLLLIAHFKTQEASKKMSNLFEANNIPQSSCFSLLPL